MFNLGLDIIETIQINTLIKLLIQKGVFTKEEFNELAKKLHDENIKW